MTVETGCARRSGLEVLRRRARPVNGFVYLLEAYLKTVGLRCPGDRSLLWDKEKQAVNNESSEIIRMLNSEFKGVAGTRMDL
jgi:glutathionyl-hydroquinone reductase